MRLSVIMSVFNAEETLEESIESILNQTFKDFELLICNDASTDTSSKIIKRFKDKDTRIKMFENTVNIGLTKSLNTLIKNSQGTYLARQDSDDISLNYRFQYQLEYFKKYDCDFVLSRAKLKNSNKLIPRFSHNIPASIVIKKKNPFIHGTLMIKKTTLNKVGNYNENFLYAQDYKLFLDLIERGVRFKHIREPLYILNTKNNISSNKKELQNYYAKCAREKIIPIEKY